MNFKDILQRMIDNDASDIFIKTGSPLKGRVYSEIVTIDDGEFSAEDINNIVSEILDGSKREILENDKSYDLAIDFSERWRFRTAIFCQSNTISLVIRKIDLNILTFDELNLPVATLENICTERQGLILLTGITGSGKSTTIAAMINFIAQRMGRHIITIEEPIEFIFKSDKSIINQRELGRDVYSYPDALRDFTLHSPDIIVIGNIRDQDTCKAALTAAETGVLVFSTMHTIDAASTAERIINFFPAQQHKAVSNQLSTLLKCVMSQKLLPRNDTRGLIPAYEIMTLSPTISGLIRENKLHEIPDYITAGQVHGMKSFNQCLVELIKSKKISERLALEHSNNKQELALKLRIQGFSRI